MCRGCCADTGRRPARRRPSGPGWHIRAGRPHKPGRRSMAPSSSWPMRRLRISDLPASVSKNHCPCPCTSGMGNGQPSAPMSSVRLESELVANRVFSASRCTNRLNSTVAWTTSGETNLCPSGPKMACSALVSWCVAAASQGADGGVRRIESLLTGGRRAQRQGQHETGHKEGQRELGARGHAAGRGAKYPG